MLCFFLQHSFLGLLESLCWVLQIQSMNCHPHWLWTVVITLFLAKMPFETSLLEPYTLLLESTILLSLRGWPVPMAFPDFSLGLCSHGVWTQTLASWSALCRWGWHRPDKCCTYTPKLGHRLGHPVLKPPPPSAVSRAQPASLHQKHVPGFSEYRNINVSNCILL